MTPDTLDRNSALTFPLELADGETVTTIGEAADLLATLSSEHRQQSYWQIAIRMLDNALHEPAYLRTATMSLQTALAMSGRLSHMNS